MPQPIYKADHSPRVSLYPPIRLPFVSVYRPRRCSGCVFPQRLSVPRGFSGFHILHNWRPYAPLERLAQLRQTDMFPCCPVEKCWRNTYCRIVCPWRETSWMERSLRRRIQIVKRSLVGIRTVWAASSPATCKTSRLGAISRITISNLLVFYQTSGEQLFTVTFIRILPFTRSVLLSPVERTGDHALQRLLSPAARHRRNHRRRLPDLVN